jgi:putative transcriptional regulator
MEQRGMTLTELADKVGVTVVNLSVLKNSRARAIRFSTLAAFCQVRNCHPATYSATRPSQPDAHARNAAHTLHRHLANLRLHSAQVRVVRDYLEQSAARWGRLARREAVCLHRGRVWSIGKV